jgi:hypothetical protein
VLFTYIAIGFLHTKPDLFHLYDVLFTVQIGNKTDFYKSKFQMQRDFI